MFDGVFFDPGVVKRIEVIQYGNRMAVFDEGSGEVPADKPCTAGDEDMHTTGLSPASESLPGRRRGIRATDRFDTNCIASGTDRAASR